MKQIVLTNPWSESSIFMIQWLYKVYGSPRYWYRINDEECPMFEEHVTWAMEMKRARSESHEMILYVSEPVYVQYLLKFS